MRTSAGILLDNVGYLAEAAQAPPEKRNRGIIKSVLAALTAAATSGVELSKAMDTWGAVLHKLVSSYYSRYYSSRAW